MAGIIRSQDSSVKNDRLLPGDELPHFRQSLKRLRRKNNFQIALILHRRRYADCSEQKTLDG
jgi:hypothetical protein